MDKFLNKTTKYRYPVRAPPRAAPLAAARPAHTPPVGTQAPASRPAPVIPEGPAHRVYDITYYSRDGRRNEWDLTEPVEAAFDPQVRGLIASNGLVEDAAEKPGSAGNKNPDVMRYDPTGLRTTMTANHEALSAALRRVRPTQLSTYEWEDTEVDDVLASYESHGLPPVPGKRYSAAGQHPHRYRPRW